MQPRKPKSWLFRRRLSSAQVSFDIDKDQDTWETEGTGDVVGRTLMKLSQKTEQTPEPSPWLCFVTLSRKPSLWD